MKRKSGFRKKLATLLAVTMTAGMMAVPSLAAPDLTEADRIVPMKVGWHLIDGNWYYRSGGLKLKHGEIFRKNSGVQDKGKAFAFDENGVMYCNELFANPEGHYDVPEGEEPPKNYYALPFGNLAENIWVKLDGEGHMYDGYGGGDDSSEIYWYFFNGKYDEEKNSGGEMLRSTEKGIDGNKYAFNQDGHMYSRSWVYLVEDPRPEYEGAVLALSEEELDDFCQSHGMNINEIKGNREYMAYYMAEGARVMDDWKIIDSHWYKFDDKGKVEIIKSLASPSDAEPMVTNVEVDGGGDQQRPAREVDSIDIVDGYEEVEAAAGDTVTLKFQVNLASDSNAKDGNEFRRSRHDVYGSLSKSGSFKIVTEKTTGICVVKYTPNLIRDEEIRLYVDDVASDPVTIKAKVTPDAVTSVLDGWQEGGFSSTSVREDLKTAILGTTGSNKASIQNALVNDQYAGLAGAYAMEKGIGETLDVAAAAKAKLGSGSVTMAGGPLNLDEQGTVLLSVAEGNKDDLTQEFVNKVAFDIKIKLNGEDPDGELAFPVMITMPVPVGYNANTMKLYHINGGEEEEVTFTVKDGQLTFAASSFSPFVFAQNEALNSQGSHSGGGSGSSGGAGSVTRPSGVTTADARKGQVNSLTGIITGDGEGYSSWQPVTGADGNTTWKLHYADGTYAAGAIITREDGTTYEQFAWEMVNGAWYAFGADGNAENGMVYDAELGGYFYIDINAGMKTGWVLVGDKWSYFNPNSDGKKGIMLVNTWIDGWYVDENGVWDGQEKTGQ